MKIDDILTLAKAGFTAEQIAALAAAEQPSAPAPVSTTPQTAADPAQSAQPEQAAGQLADNTSPENTNEDPTDPTDKLAALISAGFEEITKKMAGGIVSPSIGDIKPHGIDDIITNFFKED